MKTVVLISCVKKKLEHSAQAKDIYISDFFQKAYQYAKSLNPDYVFILSAKYGLLWPDQIVEPYEQTLNKMHLNERKAWANEVIEQLCKYTDLRNDRFIFLAGERYREFIIPVIDKIKVPMAGLSIGQQLSWLKKSSMNICDILHKLCHQQKKHLFPFDSTQIPNNGIYILFEKNECAHGTDRIVRIGTHTGDNQLKPRIKQHFIQENKDRSIFRKNIGRALLKAREDDYLKVWNLDLTSLKNRSKYQYLVDTARQQKIEEDVTNYICKNISAVFFKVDSKELRLKLESKLISTVSLCEDCCPSNHWLGLNSPIKKIRESGLWLVNELYKKPLSLDDYGQLESLLVKAKG